MSSLSFLSLALVLVWNILGVNSLSCFDCNTDPARPGSCWNVTSADSIPCSNQMEKYCSVSGLHYMKYPKEVTSERLMVTRRCGLVNRGLVQSTAQHFQDKRNPGMTCATNKGDDAEEPTVECWCTTDNCNGVKNLALQDGTILGEVKNLAHGTVPGEIPVGRVGQKGAALRIVSSCVFSLLPALLIAFL